MKINTRALLLAAAACCLLMFSSPVAQAQETEEPSLQETLEWLKTNLVKYGKATEHQKEKKPQLDGIRVEIKFSFDITAAKFDGCTLMYDQTHVFGDSEPTKTAFKLDLSKLDPLGVKVSQAEGIDPKYELVKEVWVLKLKNSGDGGEYHLRFEDREMAKRISKAFQHAIKLCGGKVEPF